MRTRLRGLLAAYGRQADAPALTVRLARGSTLLDPAALGSVQVQGTDAPGGPWRRTLRRGSADLPGVSLWHSETLPSLGPPGIPHLLTLHDLRHFQPRAQVGGTVLGHAARSLAARLLLPRWMRRVAGVVTVSEASAEAIRSRFRLPVEQVTVVPNARAGLALADVAADPGAAARITGGRPCFLAIGHLERRKHLSLLVEAMALGAGAGWEDACLVLVGEGRERPLLEQQVARHRLSGRVVFTGRLADGEVAGLLDEARALLFPSWVEGFGFPVFEALGRGCPVLATALPCLADLDPRAVRVVERDPRAWTRAMSGILQDPAGAREHARRERQRWSDQTWDRSARLLAATWRQHLSCTQDR